MQRDLLCVYLTRDFATKQVYLDMYLQTAVTHSTHTVTVNDESLRTYFFMSLNLKETLQIFKLFSRKPC